MKVLIISRKNDQGMGGLSRFYAEISTRLKKFGYKLDPANLGRLFQLVFLKIDLIYLCDATLLPLGIVLKKIFNKPLVVTAHGLDITYANPFYQKLIRFSLKKADAIILDSHPAKKLVSFIKDKQKIRVIYPGISIAHLREQKGIVLPDLTNKIVLTTVSNLVPRKGQRWFVERVLKKLSDNYLYLIVGDGEEKKSIQKSIKNLGLEKRVLLLGRVSHQELSYILRITDIYVCPNQKVKGNFESFGIATGEAAALGLPVIASNVDGLSEVIKYSKNGLLIDPTPQRFIETILDLKNPAKRLRLGQKAKSYTRKNYSWENTASEYLKIFQAVSYKISTFHLHNAPS